jgi:hypothetical protein
MERLVQIVDLGVLGVLGGQKEAKVTLSSFNPSAPTPGENHTPQSHASDLEIVECERFKENSPFCSGVSGAFPPSIRITMLILARWVQFLRGGNEYE